MQYGIEHTDRVNSLVLIGTQYTMPKRLLRFQNMLFHIMSKSVFSQIGFPKKDFISICSSMIELDFQQSLRAVSYTHLLSSTKYLQPIGSCTSAKSGVAAITGARFFVMRSE